MDLRKLKKPTEKSTRDMMDYIRRQKMLRVQKGMKKSFGHRTADVHDRDSLIEAIIAEMCKKHKKNKK